MGLVCQDIIDIDALIKPLMLKAVMTGEGEIPIDALINLQVEKKITDQLLQSIELPEDFQDLGDVICLMISMNRVKAVMAYMKGETPETTGIDKVLELVINLQMLSALSSAFGGTEQQTSS